MPAFQHDSSTAMPNSCNTSTMVSSASGCSHENDGTSRNQHGEFMARFNLIPGHERNFCRDLVAAGLLRYIWQVYSLANRNIRINETGLPQRSAVRVPDAPPPSPDCRTLPCCTSVVRGPCLRPGTTGCRWDLRIVAQG